MFSKVFALAAVVLTYSAQAHAHAAIAPVLGVAGTPKRSDVQRPSTANPCGKTNVAATIDTSTPVTAAADGSFTVTVTNFNGGKDGSRQVTMSVDATGAGKNFVAGTVTKNGQLAPATTGSEQITASLPAGTQCTGGKAGNLCLASFKTAGGFGNCVVVQQGGAAAAGGAAAGGAAAPANNGTAAATPATGATAAAAGTGKGRKQRVKGAKGGAAAANGGAATANSGTAANNGAAAEAAPADPAASTTDAAAATGTGKTTVKDRVKAALAKAAGTRAPRARLAEREDGFAIENVKRSVMSWIWA
ncbi:hypothetical protein LshimejAT787_1102910 [Lyophyllum shimeji]|uniref:Uncharacterized protein n=1 Tax=Lyophyllum shimeji TaxID=47721 RepID=A0A9P3PV73_LYOSH|nr:hypothetical protein LshimejAT787_1102910 [Lyophyllum shimeji]